MQDTDIRKDVEEILGLRVTDKQFEEALSYAERKQAYIYGREHRETVLQRWYLATLTAEYVKNLAFARFTTDLCRKRCNKEKEHSIDERPQKDIPIVAVSAL